MPALLGGYQLLTRIAVGGMAEVFLAVKNGPSGFAKRVAIKRILPHLASQPDFVAMFLDEARLAARLDHPHIVHIHDLGLDQGHYYLAMEHVAGEDVEAIRRAASERGGRVPDVCAAALLEQACRALDYAHEQGVIHRDVTPSNLLVSYDGVLKLADFGIAKAEARATRTEAGALKGKIAYMSPEQANGLDVDRRSDVYALGICGWELLAGRRLHGGTDDLETLARVRTGVVPPLAEVRPDAPAALVAILERALERDPARRWPTARAFGDELAAWLHAAAPAGAGLPAYMTELFGEGAAARVAAQFAPSEPTAPAPRFRLSRRMLAQLPLELARMPLLLARAPFKMARLPFARARLELPRARLILPLFALLLSGVGLLLALAHPPSRLQAPPALEPLGVAAPVTHAPAPAHAPLRRQRPGPNAFGP